MTTDDIQWAIDYINDKDHMMELDNYAQYEECVKILVQVAEESLRIR